MKKHLIFKLIGSKTRFDILSTLKNIPRPVFAIADKLDMTHSAVSHQLAVLSKAKIVQRKQIGRMQMYSFCDNKQGKYVRSII